MVLSAEEAYAFAHNAVRDAAYQLWLPSDRARLHGFSLEILESEGGSPERLASELAEHAHFAQQGVDAQRDAPRLRELREKELNHLRMALEAAERRYQHGRVVEVAQRMLGSAVITPEEAARVEAMLAGELHASGRLDLAWEHYQRGMDIARRLGSAKMEAESLLGQSRVMGARGKTAEAEQLMLQSMAVAKQGGDKGGEAHALSWLAGLYEDTGRAHLCEEMQLRAAKLAQEAGNESMRLASLGNLANHYRHTGRLNESVEVMAQVLAGFEKLGQIRGIGTALNNQARTLMLLGRLDEAEAAFARSLAILEPTGQMFSVAFALGNVAEVWLARGQLARARQALERAIAICNETASLMHGAAYMARLSGVCLLLGERERAQELAEEARTAFLQSGSGQYIPDYCDIVRLRLAADAATEATGLVERKTAKVHALAPRASWLPVMRQILAGMKASLARQKTGVHELAKNIEAGAALLAEIEAAVRENRPAAVFRGHLPGELPAPLREGLLALMAQAHPGELAALRKLRPDLHAALSQ